jgi:hypothetical protein
VPTNGPSNQALIAQAKRWLSGAFDGIGNTGTVGGEKVRVYSDQSFSHSFKGYAAARERYGSDYGQILADVRTGARTDLSGSGGLVGETVRGSSPVMLAEVFDFATGDSVAISQPFRKSFMRKKPVGSPEVSDAEPLVFRPDSPGQKARFKELRAMSDARLAARHDDLSRAGARLEVSLSRRGGDKNMWDFVLIPCWGPTQGSDWKGVQVWEDETSMTTDDVFSRYIDARVALALAGPPPS